VGWSETPSGSTNPLSIHDGRDKVITATFAINIYTITASAGPNGSITAIRSGLRAVWEAAKVST